MATQTGCGWFSNDFAMTVDRVDEFKGFIFKGISIAGRVTVGCIANEDEYVERMGRKCAYREEKVLVGDGVVSKSVPCRKNAEK